MITAVVEYRRSVPSATRCICTKACVITPCAPNNSSQAYVRTTNDVQKGITIAPIISNCNFPLQDAMKYAIGSPRSRHPTTVARVMRMDLSNACR
jgi:hypothetical protein